MYDIVGRLRNHSKRPVGCDCVRCEAASILVGIETQLREWYADDMCFGGDRMDEIHQLWEEARRER